MAVLDYSYIPQYGVEPYVDSVPGGAKVTGDNLLISLWTVEDKGSEPPDPFLAIGDIVRPSTIDTSFTGAEGVHDGLANAMHSRCSAKFFFGPSGTKDSPFTWPLLAVLNPPDELKQQLAGAVAYTGDSDPTDLANYTVSKSLQGCNAWEFSGALVFGALNYILPAIEGAYGYSAYLPFVPYGIPGLSFQLPFLQTNGANGEVPLFFDNTTEAGMRAMIAAINRGDFYVGAFLSPQIDIEGAYVEVRWPHSTARG